MPHALYRTLRWGLAVIITLLIIAVVVLELMPWTFLKPIITERVESATGRDLDIRGDVSVSLWPRPHIELEQLALANADWAKAPEMLTIRNLEITPSLISLIRGDLVIDDIEIGAPTLYLQGREGQQGNWMLPGVTSGGQSGGPDQRNTDGGDGGGFPVTVQQLSVSDGKIRYLAPGADTPWVASLPSLQVSGDHVSLEGSVATGSGNKGQELPVEFSAQYQPGLSDGQWKLNDIQARVNKTSINGQLSLNTGGKPPTLDGTLHSPSVNVSQLLAAIPKGPQPDDKTGVSIPVLPALNGSVKLTVDQVMVQTATLSNVSMEVKLAEHRMTLAGLSFAMATGQVEGTASLTSSPDLITAEAQLTGQGIQLQQLGVGQNPGRITDVKLDLGVERFSQSARVPPRVLLNHLFIREARASYQRSAEVDGAATDLEFRLERAGEPPTPALSVNGQFQDKPLTMTIEGAPFPQLLDGLETYPLQAQAQSGELTAWADSQLGAVLSPATFAGKLVLKGSGGQDLERWVSTSLPPLGEYRVAGHLSRDHQRWSATSVAGNIGTTEVTGEVHVNNTEKPQVTIDLNAGRIELARLLPDNGADGVPANGNDPSGSDSPLSTLRAFNGQLALHADTLVTPAGLALDDLQVDASLNSGNLTITPLAFNIGGGSVTSTLTLDATDPPASGDLNAEFDQIALSRFGETFTVLEERLGSLSGELELQITEVSPGEQRQDVLLPFIGRLAFEPSRLRFTDPGAGTDITFSLQTRGLASGGQTLFVNGDGQYDGAPFSLTFHGDPLLDARVPDRPYNLELSSTVVGTRIQAQGTITRPLALQGMDLQLELEGPNPERLTRLLGVPLPDLPRYSVSGDLSLKSQRWAFTDLTGKVGSSDISGRITLDTAPRPPHLAADLQSNDLNFEDLGSLVGKPSDSTSTSGDRYVLPDEPILSDNWQNLTADVRYRAESVRAADIPLSNVVIDLSLSEGQAAFEPVRFTVGGGYVDFKLHLDTNPEPPEGTMQLEVRAVNLDKALRDLPLAEGTVGTVGGQGKFWVTGASLADLLGSADGGLVMLMTGGKINALLVELAGLDAAEAFLSWVSAQDPIPIDCAYTDLQVRDGLVRLDTLAVDTTDTTFTGTGTINFQRELLDIAIQAHPKDISPLSARTPLYLGGTFNNIDPGLNESGLALKAGGSLALAALASPVTALLPLLDLGAGNQVPYCHGLVSRAREAIGDKEDDSNEPDNNDS